MFILMLSRAAFPEQAFLWSLLYILKMHASFDFSLLNISACLKYSKYFKLLALKYNFETSGSCQFPLWLGEPGPVLPRADKRSMVLYVGCPMERLLFLLQNPAHVLLQDQAPCRVSKPECYLSSKNSGLQQKELTRFLMDKSLQISLNTLLC